MGVIFMIALGIGYMQTLKTRGEVLENRIEVPDLLVREFDRVITKNRAQAMPSVRFTSPEGEELGWEDFDGQYLLVNFWATWCAPCVVELPSLDKLRKRFEGQGLEVIAVSIDKVRPQEQIKKFLYNRRISNFAAYLDDYDDIQRNIRMRGIPTTYLLGPNGNILHIFEGDANWMSPPSLSFFKNLLNRPK